MMMWDAFQREALIVLGHTLYFPAPPPLLPEDPLLRALLRAAGRDLSAADARQLLQNWPTTAQLRRDAAAKRALWPSLRTLRCSVLRQAQDSE